MPRSNRSPAYELDRATQEARRPHAACGRGVEQADDREFASSCQVVNRVAEFPAGLIDVRGTGIDGQQVVARWLAQASVGSVGQSDGLPGKKHDQHVTGAGLQAQPLAGPPVEVGLRRPAMEWPAGWLIEPQRAGILIGQKQDRAWTPASRSRSAIEPGPRRRARPAAAGKGKLLLVALDPDQHCAHSRPSLGPRLTYLGFCPGRDCDSDQERQRNSAAVRSPLSSLRGHGALSPADPVFDSECAIRFAGTSMTSRTTRKPRSFS